MDHNLANTAFAQNLENTKSKTGLAFFGSPSFAVPILQALATDFAIKLVITQPAQPVGKHRRIQATAVAEAAEQLDIPVLSPTKLRGPEMQAQLASCPVELAVVAAYGRILPGWLLDWPARGMLNVHGSLLPNYRGASPISAAILDGQAETGVTFMAMNERMDEGGIIAKAELAIAPTDTADSLSQRLSRLAADQIVSVVRHYLANTLTAHPQPQPATYTRPLNRQDGFIDLNNIPVDLERRIRAYSPWPGVWSLWQGKRIKLLPKAMIQLEGKRATPLADFLLGHPDFPLKEIV